MHIFVFKILSYRIRKTLTAYNIFVQHEREFVMNSLKYGDSVNTQQILGKHCSKRWKCMEPEERALYISLNETIKRDAK